MRVVRSNWLTWSGERLLVLLVYLGPLLLVNIQPHPILPGPRLCLVVCSVLCIDWCPSISTFCLMIWFGDVRIIIFVFCLSHWRAGTCGATWAFSVVKTQTGFSLCIKLTCRSWQLEHFHDSIIIKANSILVGDKMYWPGCCEILFHYFFYHKPVEWPWGSHFTLLDLHFCIYKITGLCLMLLGFYDLRTKTWLWPYQTQRRILKV